MQTECTVTSIHDLARVLSDAGRVTPDMIGVSPYVFDARTGWDTHIVTVKGAAVGFTDGPLSAEHTVSAPKVPTTTLQDIGRELKAIFGITDDQVLPVITRYQEQAAVMGYPADSQLSIGEWLVAHGHEPDVIWKAAVEHVRNLPTPSPHVI